MSGLRWADESIKMKPGRTHCLGLLKLEGLNALETDAGIFDCGNKKRFLSANLMVGMRDHDNRLYFKRLTEGVEF